MLPSVQITKAAFGTGGAPPSAVGIAAIVAASFTGTANVASSFARDDLALAAFGVGPLVEYASYCLQVGGNPTLLVKGNASTAGSYGTATQSGTSTSAITTSGVPLDEYNASFTVVNGFTVGTTGGTITYSLDGQTQSGVTAVGTANSFTIPNSGVTFNFGAGAMSSGFTYSVFTNRPLNTDVDLATALEALRISRQPWEGVLIDSTLGTGTVGLVDTWLAGLEKVGQFHFALLNYRHKIQPVPATETEAAYATAITNATAAQASIRLCVGADAADYTSTITGWSQPRPTSMFLAARAMLIPIGEDPAFVGRGNLEGATISDGNGNPRWHDEDLYPDLDSQRLVSLRSFAPGGPNGVYITDANVLSPAGSDFVWLQHVRTMNAACTVAWQQLTRVLSIGVGKKPADPTTGNVYIAEKDAARIEGIVNAALQQALNGQVAAVQFTLSRNDILNSNTDSTVTGTVAIVSLAYIKLFKVISTFVTSI